MSLNPEDVPEEVLYNLMNNLNEALNGEHVDDVLEGRETVITFTGLEVSALGMALEELFHKLTDDNYQIFTGWSEQEVLLFGRLMDSVESKLQLSMVEVLPELDLLNTTGMYDELNSVFKRDED